MKALIAPLAVFAASPMPALAQGDFQQWLGVSARVKLSEEVSIQSDNQLRFSGDRGGLFQAQSALLLAYRATPKITVAAGYLHIPNYVRGSFTSMERRAREQVTFDNLARVGKATVSARLRAEQRWRDDLGGTAWRVRPFARLSIPLGGDSAPALQVSEELFVNLNTTPFQSVTGVERLRSAVVLAIPLSGSIRLDTGYLNQHRFVPGGRDSGEHALTASLALSF